MCHFCKLVCVVAYHNLRSELKNKIVNFWAVTDRVLPHMILTNSKQIWRANAGNVSFTTSLRWPVYIINLADKTEWSCYFSHWCCTTVSFKTYPLYSYLVSDQFALCFGLLQIHSLFLNRQKLQMTCSSFTT